jgi:hypothetical protein
MRGDNWQDTDGETLPDSMAQGSLVLVLVLVSALIFVPVPFIINLPMVAVLPAAIPHRRAITLQL